MPVDINTFMSNHKRTTKFSEYEIIVQAISSNKNYFLKFWEHQQSGIQSKDGILI